jgi:hypothetical protein
MGKIRTVTFIVAAVRPLRMVSRASGTPDREVYV